MKIGSMNVYKEQNDILFMDDEHKGEVLRLSYENLVEMLFVLRGMSEHESHAGVYVMAHVYTPKAGYILQFGSVRKFFTIKEAFILMMALEGVIHNAL